MENEPIVIEDTATAVPAKPKGKKAKPVSTNPAEVTRKSSLPHTVPTLLTGGDLSAWKVDLARINSIAVSKDDGKTWTVVHAGEDSKEKAVRIPDVQFRALCFILLSVATNPCSDRGAAYRIWVSDNRKQLVQELGSYMIRAMFYEKSLLPGLLLPVKVATDIAPAQATTLVASSVAFKPKGRIINRKAQKAEEVDLVL